MEAAAGIKRCRAGRACGCAVQIFIHREFMSARAAKHCFFMKLRFWPNLVRSAADGLVAFKTGEILSAAIEFNGNPVDFRMVMNTTGFAIDVQSFDRQGMSHGNPPFSRGLK